MREMKIRRSSQYYPRACIPFQCLCVFARSFWFIISNRSLAHTRKRRGEITPETWRTRLDIRIADNKSTRWFRMKNDPVLNNSPVLHSSFTFNIAKKRLTSSIPRCTTRIELEPLWLSDKRALLICPSSYVSFQYRSREVFSMGFLNMLPLRLWVNTEHDWWPKQKPGW